MTILTEGSSNSVVRDKKSGIVKIRVARLAQKSHINGTHFQLSVASVASREYEVLLRRDFAASLPLARSTTSRKYFFLVVLGRPRSRKISIQLLIDPLNIEQQ